MEAAYHGMTDVVMELVKRGANLNLQNKVKDGICINVPGTKKLRGWDFLLSNI